MSPLVALALRYLPEGIRNAGWVARFLAWREEKRKKGELDSQRRRFEEREK
jgi:hypothetical protein